MNVNDMETVRSILFANKYLEVDDERKVIIFFSIFVFINNYSSLIPRI